MLAEAKRSLAQFHATPQDCMHTVSENGVTGFIHGGIRCYGRNKIVFMCDSAHAIRCGSRLSAAIPAPIRRHLEDFLTTIRRLQCL